jgi:hypothetical protein
MLQAIVQTGWLIVLVAVLTATLEMFVSNPARRAPTSPGAGTFLGFLIGGLLLGAFIVAGYHGLRIRLGAGTDRIFRPIVIAVGVVLALGVNVLGRGQRGGGRFIWTVMIAIWALGYGLGLPGLLGG